MRLTKTISILIITALVSIQTYFIIRIFGGEVFDRLIYAKSSRFGYNPATGLCPTQLNNDGYRDKEFSPKKPGEYLVLVVGDSIVYGKGLLQSQRFSNVLEKKLNRIRPTRVFNLGECGTNIYKHYLVVQKYQELFNPDLVIIAFYGNDLLVWNDKNDFPRELTTSDKLVKDFLTSSPKTIDEYRQRVLGTFDESTDNWKMLVYLLDKLPKTNTLYFFVIFEDNEIYKQNVLNIQELFEQRGFAAINPLILIQQKYREESLEVSKLELHPNGLANKIFAERLYQEITSNPEYGFIPKISANPSELHKRILLFLSQ